MSLDISLSDTAPGVVWWLKEPSSAVQQGNGLLSGSPPTAETQHHRPDGMLRGRCFLVQTAIYQNMFKTGRFQAGVPSTAPLTFLETLDGSSGRRPGGALALVLGR